MNACVIGHPIRHSRSPLIHNHWLALHGLPGRYDRQDVTPEQLAPFLRGLAAAGYCGCNVTIPHKEAVLSLADVIHPTARAIGAANLLWIEGGRLHADNTDAAGYVANLDAEAPGWRDRVDAALVLGAGGAARAVIHGLLAAGVARILIHNRTSARADALAAVFGSRVVAVPDSLVAEAANTADLLVNTTLVGMAGDPALPIPLATLEPGTIVSDIVYVPLETPLIVAARARGLAVVPGLGMLLHQAVGAFARWYGITPRVTPELRALIEADVRASG
jgi:shikimate dehydrogenase